MAAASGFGGLLACGIYFSTINRDQGRSAMAKETYRYRAFVTHYCTSE
jgi:hypothetical protein